MSCLYSSPEVKNLEVKSLGFRLGFSPSSPRRLVWQASGATNHSAVQFHRDFTATRNRQGRIPQQRKLLPAAASIILLAKQAQVFLREYSSAISGFRSLCGQEQRSSFSHRAQLDLRFGTFHSGRALALRTLATIRNISKSLRGNCGASNPGPMLWPERSRSRGIFQAVVLYPNRALWGLFSARDRPPDARQIDLGRPFAG